MLLRCAHVAALLAISIATAGSAWAGTLRIGNPSIKGENVIFPIVLEGDVGAGVSQANFRLTYDTDVLEPVTVQTGPAAEAADKDVSSNLTDDGRYNVIMFGLNQTTVESGEVAQVVMRVKPGAESARVGISNVTLSDPNAVAIPARGMSEVLRFDGSNVERDDDAAEPEGDDADSETGSPTRNPDRGDTADPEAPTPGGATVTSDPRVPVASAPSTNAGGPRAAAVAGAGAGASNGSDQASAPAGAKAGAGAAPFEGGTAAVAGEALKSVPLPGSAGDPETAANDAETNAPSVDGGDRTAVAVLANPAQGPNVPSPASESVSAASAAASADPASPSGTPLLPFVVFGVAVVVIVGAIVFLRRKVFS